MNFNTLKIFSVSYLNLDCWQKKCEKYGEIMLITFHFKCWKKCMKNQCFQRWKRFTFSADSINFFQKGRLCHWQDLTKRQHSKQMWDPWYLSLDIRDLQTWKRTLRLYFIQLVLTHIKSLYLKDRNVWLGSLCPGHWLHKKLLILVPNPWFARIGSI